MSIRRVEWGTQIDTSDWISKDGVARRLHAGELVSSHGAIRQTPHPTLA